MLIIKSWTVEMMLKNNTFQEVRFATCQTKLFFPECVFCSRDAVLREKWMLMLNVSFYCFF